MSPLRYHIFDAIARDQVLVRETESEEEIEYEHGSSDDDEEFRRRRRGRNKSRGAGRRRFVIHLFGTTAEGQTASIEVRGFCPSFYVELPPTGNPAEHCDTILRRLGSKHPVKGEVVRRRKLIGYTGGRSYSFVKLTVESLSGFYETRRHFLDEQQCPKMRLGSSAPLRVYEANLDPMLRFFHTRGIAPCGWIDVQGTAVDDSHVVCEWEDVSPAVSDVVVAPLLVGAWDIECYSADGEFPMAQQGYRRVAKQLWSQAGSAEEAARLLEEGMVRKPGATVIVPPFRNGAKGLNQINVKKCVDRLGDDLVTAWAARAGASTGKAREEGMAALTQALDRVFSGMPLAGDPVIQIGTVATRGSGAPVRHIFVLGGCDDIAGAVVHRAATESQLILDWFAWVVAEDFDVLVGYNTFGFDEHYMWDRMEELRLTEEPVVQAMTRLEGGEVKLVEKMLSSSALGDNLLYLWTTPGRLRIDLYGHIKRKTQLSSYKLDSVCAAFLSGKLGGISRLEHGRWLLKTKQTGDARVGRSLQILDELGEELSEKMVIVAIESGGLIVESEEDLAAVGSTAVRWAVVKDDVSPADIFRLHRGTNADRATVAAYCIQDCDLVMELYKKLEVFNEAMSMANVCSVPVTYIFTRGQGIKIESLIFEFCASVGQLIEVMPGASYGSAAGAALPQDSYEGAIVLDPAAGFYGPDTPVGVCDFASLYPSTIISENISHDMLVWTKDYGLDGRFLGFRHGSDEDEKLAPAGTQFTDIEFDIWRPAVDDARKHPEKLRAGTRICRFAQPMDNVKGSLPTIVAKLLAARKAKREELKRTADPFKKALLDAEQNAYKITANSLYGQLGSGTFKVRLQHLAASVTAYGRKQILFAQAAIQRFYGPEAHDPRCSAEGAKVVYGDSVLGDTPLLVRYGASSIAQYIRIDMLSDFVFSNILCGSTQWSTWHNTKEAVETPGLEVWTEKGWTAVIRLLRHRLAPGKKLWRVQTLTGIVDCTEDHSLVAEDGTELRPNEVIQGYTTLLHHSLFPQNTYCNYEAYSADPVKYGVLDKLTSSILFLSAQNGSYDVFIDENLHIHPLTSDLVHRNIVRQMRELPSGGVDFVYDLDTANHHFAVGPGALVVHNTDSLFVNFNPRNPETGERLTGRDARVATIELTEEAGKFISSALKAPHEFEYDKVFAPFLIFSKKRYVGNKYEESPDEFKETSMGIVLKRRDNAPLLKILYSAALNRLLNHGDIPGAVKCVKEGVKDLVAGRTKLSQLTITKSLRSEYLTPTPPAHKVLADRMTARDPGNAPASGERLGYVYIQTPVGQEASRLQGERVETPQWIVAHGLKPDARHYIEHQLMKPLGELFGVLVEQMPGFRMPAGGWDSDTDKRAAQRQVIAYDLLFREGLAALDSAATRAFVGRLGAVTATSAGVKPQAKTQTQAKSQTQTTLTQFMKPSIPTRETALINDGFAAAAMGRAQAAKKAAKPKVDGTVMALKL